MKNHIHQKINFIKIFLPICVVALLSACDLLEESPKDFLEDYGSIASVAKTEFSTEVVPQGAWQNIGSSGDVTINCVIENPGDHRLRAKVTFPNEIVLPEGSIVFPENDGLLQSWTEKVDDGAGGTTQITRTESETNFLKSKFSITFPQDFLVAIDGDVSKFDISPTVLLYRADFGAEERPQSSHTIRLRCNTPPEKISNAMGEKIVADGKETLVLAIELPALKSDDKSLTVEENGRKHIFERQEGATNFDGATSSYGWTISSAEPAGMEAATYDEDGKPITPADKGWTPNCYITTDIDIKGLAPFDIALTLTDEGGLTSRHSFTSHGRKLDPPKPVSSNTTLEQDESDGMATYTLQATDGATIHYTVTQMVGNVYSDSGSGTSPLVIKLPAGTFTITAHAEKEGFAKSDDFTESVTVNPSVFFVSAEGNDTNGNGAKSAPFATIKKAVDSFTSASPTIAKIFILGDLKINKEISANLSGKTLYLQGRNGGNIGSRVTLSCAIADKTKSMFVIDGNVEMRDLDITQTSDVITSGIFVNIKSELTLQNISLSGMTTDTGAVTLNIDSVSNNPSGILNILGGVKIIGNKSASGDDLNLQLRTGTHIKIYPGSLSETQIGVTTETEPTNSNAVQITSGYGTNYGTRQPSEFFTSDDARYNLQVYNGEVRLVASGGTIIVTPPKEIKFSFDGNNISKTSNSGDGSNITIYAFGDGVKLNADAFTNWAIQLFVGTTDVPDEYYPSASGHFSTNPFSFASGLDSGNYKIYVTATYGGKKYSGELHYDYTKP